MSKCTCGPNEACSQCADTAQPTLPDVALDEVRRHLLNTIYRHTGYPPLGQTSTDVRNLATAYGILTDKALAEGRVTVMTLADGSQVAYDAYGRVVIPPPKTSPLGA